MGQTLSEPVVEKVSDKGENKSLIYGVSSMQGWRISMEDSHSTILNLAESLAFFAVFDGHGGEKVAQYCGENLSNILLNEPAFKKGDYSAALKSAFLNTDQALLQDSRFGDDPSGCTATCAIISPTQIICANAGDSRTVLGSMGTAIPLSEDHKPQNEEEKARICAAGGYVDFGRVNGNLALSRAIGDFEFKRNDSISAEEQIVTAFPDVTVHSLSDDDEFLIIACDGIWDCLSSQSTVEFVRRGIVSGQELVDICENLMDTCLAPSCDTAGVGCDNMTVVIVALLRNGESKEEWYDRIRERVENNQGPCAPPEFAERQGTNHGFAESSSEPEDDYTQGSRMFAVHATPKKPIILGHEANEEAVNEDNV